jgi:NAD(P)-dependent dehydrogenase (short-subunit alcohol dehydrogenase family)
MTERVPDFARDFLVQRCPQRRAAKPEEIAAAALWLCSDRASFVNGESLHVSGGLTDIPL